MKIVILIALLLSGTYYWYTKNIQIHALKKKKIATPKAKAKKPKPLVENNAYRCVMIQTGSDACAAAKALNKNPILMSEASALPLKVCDKTTCNCRFTRHDDRRMDVRRNDRYMATQTLIRTEDSRAKEDRRKGTK